MKTRGRGQPSSAKVAIDISNVAIAHTTSSFALFACARVTRGRVPLPLLPSRVHAPLHACDRTRQSTLAINQFCNRRVRRKTQ